MIGSSGGWYLALTISNAREAHTAAQGSAGLTRPQELHGGIPSALGASTHRAACVRRRRAMRLAKRMEGRGATKAISVTSFFRIARSEEHTSELQSLRHLVCRL